jgi:MFS family permease
VFRTFQDLGETLQVRLAILGNMEATLNAGAMRIGARHWLILITAGIGFAFDMYEMVVQAIVLRPMLVDLEGYLPGTREFNHWAGLALFLPPVLGGLASLAGGYLTDRIGRQRVLVWSIVIYGAAAFMSGLATSVTEVIFWRCLTVAGACVEFIAAIAWLTELFPDARRRETVLGFAQACATLGNFMIAGAYYVAVTWGDQLPEVHGGHAAWRYALMFGALPAIPLVILRPFLPESPVWQQKHLAGSLRRPSFRELFTPRRRRVTLIGMLTLACCYALAYGMLQHIPRIAPGLPGIAELTRQQQEQWVSLVHLHQDFGAFSGRILFALLVTWLVVRGPILRWALGAVALIVPLVFLGPSIANAHLFAYGAGLSALVVSATYSFWGNYLPRMYPVHLRGTGESFAISVGGRVLAPAAALATTKLSDVMPGASPTDKLALAIAVVGTFTACMGWLLASRLPEPPADLPED